MRRLLLAVVLLMAVCHSASSRDVPSLGLEMKIVNQEHCQFTADIQGVTLHVALRFLNPSKDDILIQQISGVNLTVVAKSIENIDSGVYELNWQPERFEPTEPKKSKPIVLKPGGSIEIMDAVSLNVVRNSLADASKAQLAAGRHYLQIAEEIITGDASPSTWRSATVRSAPVGLTIDYLDKTIQACSRKGPEQ